MNYRTDLAYDEISKIADEESFICDRKKYKGIIMDHIKVLKKENILEKEMGDYITIEIQSIDDKKTRDTVAEVVAEALKSLMSDNMNKILIVGLGNEQVTADSLGPMVADKIIVTSHLIKLNAIKDPIRDVSVVVPKVMGQTGIETANLVKAISDHIKPDLILAIDALATNSIERINRVIQLSNTGIRPGGGVGNNRMAIHQDTLNVPVFAIGVATVMSVKALILESLKVLDINDDSIPNVLEEHTPYKMVVTPKEMDEEVRHLEEIIAMGINQGLFPNFSNF